MWGWPEHFALLPSLFFYWVGQSPGRVSSAWEDVWLCMSAGAPWRQISWYLAMLLFSSRQLSLSAGCDQRSHSFWSGLGFCACSFIGWPIITLLPSFLHPRSVNMNQSHSDNPNEAASIQLVGIAGSLFWGLARELASAIPVTNIHNVSHPPCLREFNTLF